MRVHVKMGGMAKKRRNRATSTGSTRPLPAPFWQVLVALLAPIFTAVVIDSVTRSYSSQANQAPILAMMGLASWFVGVFFYQLDGLALRGGRPLFAGIGFATLGWVLFVLLRAILLPIEPEIAGSTRAFIYLLLFESFAVQLWTFGSLFRAVSIWRGPLTAAIIGGVVFAATAVVLFQNSYGNQGLTLIYYITWGIFYGIIRLRTGSIVGPILIQALQTFTAWVALGPLSAAASPNALFWIYGLSSAGYLLFIWRLWPKTKSDYRV